MADLNGSVFCRRRWAGVPLGLVEPDISVLRCVGVEFTAAIFYPAKQCGVTPVEAVDADSGVLNSMSIGLLDKFASEVYLTGGFDLFFGDAGFETTLLVFDLFVGQKQTCSYDRGVGTIGQAAEYTNLTVVNFPESTVILACHASGKLAFLGEARFIQREHGFTVVADPRIGLLRNISIDIRVIPTAVGNEVLQILGLRVSQGIGYSLGVLARGFGKQPVNVALGMPSGVLRTLCCWGE